MSLILTLLVACLAYVLLATVTGSVLVGIVAAIVVLVAGVPVGSYR